MKSYNIALLFGILMIGNTDLAQVPMDSLAGEENEGHTLAFSEEWKILGPFRIGTREAIWGVDPLETPSFGGFHNLQFTENDVFRSPLSINGTVSWQEVTSKPTNSKGSSRIDLTVDFPEVDWSRLRSVYGWAALQCQGWARGYLDVKAPTSRRIVLFTDNILEVRINNVHVFGGDFYAFRRAPLVVTLSPGKNVLDVRLVREIRAMGGADSAMTVSLEANVSSNTLNFLRGTAILPDLVDGKLPSRFASITVRNEGEDWMELWDCDSSLGSQTGTTKAEDGRLRIAPGQSRPVVFYIAMDDPDSNQVAKSFAFKKVGVDSAYKIEKANFELTRRSLRMPHKMTFLHPSGAVSYAILKPPPDVGKRQGSETALPIHLSLHGAGLEADSHQVRHMLDSVPDLHAWNLFPSGMTPWSGDDWHTWGFADVRAAILAISDWIEAVRWDGPGVLTHKWFVSGHSNGGQGTWHVVSHQPDRVLATAVVAGYSSIEAYVPYSLWKEAPPLLTAVVHQAMTSFSHELLVENMADTPIIIQHGSDDDNVPPYHSRLMNSLLGEAGAGTAYVELPKKGHWFEGAMVTTPLRAFYHQHLPGAADAHQPPKTFSIKVPNSDDMGSRWGVVVDQLQSPDNFGKIDISVSNNVWRLSTANIHRLHLNFTNLGIEPPDEVYLDGKEVAWSDQSKLGLEISFVQSGDSSWEKEVGENWMTLQQRFGRQRGAMDAIMRTDGPFKIHFCSANSFDIALQVSRNLHQYYYADSTISSGSDRDIDQAGNRIFLAVGQDLTVGELESFPINIMPTGIILSKSGRSSDKVIPMEAGLGAIFLRPLSNQRLELVVWGADEDGLRQAARFVPTLTGVGQADFIIVNKRVAWLGHAGAIAMGFFDYKWQISEGSFVS